MTTNRLTIGFSPCPNDTFIFHGLVHKQIQSPAVEFEQEILADVETLNQWALAGKLDVTKLSFYALGHVLDQYELLTAGAALGRGCGPLLVAFQDFRIKDLVEKTIAIPGRYTTAAMLLRLFAPECRHLVEMPFNEIMPSILTGEVDSGVIIHESRFTYQQKGLALIQDLGSWWEEISGYPIPLGCIAAKRSLGRQIIRLVDASIRESVRRALADPDSCMNYIRQNAQELDDQVITDHIGLYVNQYSLNLGTGGLRAVKEFLRRGRAAGFLPESTEILTAGGDNSL